MGDMLRDGMTWLEGQRHTHLSRTVTYQRQDASVNLLATVGRRTYELEDAEGVVHSFASRDFLVRRIDLILSGVETVPQAGDRIIETIAGVANEYEVACPRGFPVYEDSDPNKETLRIHTKQVT